MTNVGPEGQNDIQQAMQDVLAIRRSILSFQNNKDRRVEDSRYRVNLLTHSLTILFILFFLWLEFFNGQWITATMMQNTESRFARILILSTIGGFVFLCLGIFYFSVHRAAGKGQETMSDYVKRNFLYLQNLNQLSDLIVKFSVIAVLIWAKLPDWVAAFLFLFTGDYLIQGRFFNMRLGLAQLLGVVSMLAGFAAFYFGDPRVAWPLLWYLFLTVLSFHNLIRMKRVKD